MRATTGPVLALLGVLLPAAVPARAQEPQPVRVRASGIADAGGLQLRFAWRYAPGDAPGREAPGLDDSGWRPVVPAMPAGGVPDDWDGVGWFRRHLLVEPALQGRTLALRFAAPGAADVFLDGRLVLATGRGAARPELPWPRRDASLVELSGHRHLLAVRYVFPAGASAPADGIGFRLSLADPDAAAGADEEPGWRKGLRGALAALPAFLAFLHLVLFRFDRRARQNLFYAFEMGAFALVVLKEYKEDLLATTAQREALDALCQGVPVVAILFGLLTYYAVRTSPFPRSWRAFVAASGVLFVASYAWPASAGYLWIPLFGGVIVEVARVEIGGRTTPRRGAGFFLASFGVLGITIVLQVLVVLGALDSVAGTRAVYVLGIVASAAGMSLFLGRSFAEARLAEAENERRGRELDVARQLQLSMLPRALPEAPGLDVAAATDTATEVGGDFYDLRRDREGLLVAFGDATGHGLAAGIVVTAAKALFTSLPAGSPLPELLETCSRAFLEMNLPRLRMSLALARVSPREVAVVSAAVPPLLLHRAETGAVEELGAGALPLGSRRGGGYEERRAALAPGDTLLFASDGFAELRSADGGELGYDGAARAFREAAAAPGATAREVVESLGAAVDRLRGGRPIEDDVTFLVVRVVSPPAAHG